SPRSTRLPYTTLFRSVLEPLDVERVATAVGQHARHEEAREPTRRLGEHEEGVRHRGAAEPLVAGEAIRVAGWFGARRVRAHIRRSEEHTSELQSRENL